MGRNRKKWTYSVDIEKLKAYKCRIDFGGTAWWVTVLAKSKDEAVLVVREEFGPNPVEVGPPSDVYLLLEYQPSETIVERRRPIEIHKNGE